MIVDIKKRRKELGLTLEEIGKMVGVSKSTVKKWESGYIRNMRRDKIMLLAGALMVSPLDILDSSEASSFSPGKIIQKTATTEFQDFIKSFFQCDGIEHTVILNNKTHTVCHKLSAEAYKKILELLSTNLL